MTQLLHELADEGRAAAARSGVDAEQLANAESALLRVTPIELRILRYLEAFEDGWMEQATQIADGLRVPHQAISQRVRNLDTWGLIVGQDFHFIGLKPMYRLAPAGRVALRIVEHPELAHDPRARIHVRTQLAASRRPLGEPPPRREAMSA